MDDVVMNIVGNMGFPIAVCFYTLFRLENTVKANTQAILDLSAKIGGASK
ncbi:YvrJ family protein [Priestia flexa]|nr:YvrJ family protein [Priestia flexa]